MIKKMMTLPERLWVRKGDAWIRCKTTPFGIVPVGGGKIIEWSEIDFMLPSDRARELVQERKKEKRGGMRK